MIVAVTPPSASSEAIRGKAHDQVGTSGNRRSSLLVSIVVIEQCSDQQKRGVKSTLTTQQVIAIILTSATVVRSFHRLDTNPMSKPTGQKTVVSVTSRNPIQIVEKFCATNPWQYSVWFCHVCGRCLEIERSRAAQHRSKWALSGRWGPSYGLINVTKTCGVPVYVCQCGPVSA